MNELSQVALMIAGAAGLGTCLGGVGAYLAIRADLINVVQRFEAHAQSVDQRFNDMEHRITERFAIVNQTAVRAHERIDEILGLPRASPAPAPAPLFGKQVTTGR